MRAQSSQKRTCVLMTSNSRRFSLYFKNSVRFTLPFVSTNVYGASFTGQPRTGLWSYTRKLAEVCACRKLLCKTEISNEIHSPRIPGGVPGVPGVPLCLCPRSGRERWGQGRLLGEVVLA